MSSESDKENRSEETGQKRRGSALVYPPKKCPLKTDPMVHRGRHFGRTVSAIITVKTLVSEGIARHLRLHKEEIALSDLVPQEQREHQVFTLLLEAVPDLLERMGESLEAGMHICSMLQKGINSACCDDTKGLKGAMIDWLIKPGEPCSPPLFRNSKVERGYNHELTGCLLCPAGWDWDDPEIKGGLRSGATVVTGEDWPMFLYEDGQYEEEEPWKGLFRGDLLVKGYKFIFTSPSSVDFIEPKATRGGNASIHGMTEVTLASIAYVATQVVTFELPSVFYMDAYACGFFSLGVIHSVFPEHILSNQLHNGD
ncbi:hypothetical protein HWV62_23120 [Athelia sp. TMB]|nr:hypothetical protein HWV62_23120 [Athelia sp. TMB]